MDRFKKMPFESLGEQNLYSYITSENWYFEKCGFSLKWN